MDARRPCVIIDVSKYTAVYRNGRLMQYDVMIGRFQPFHNGHLSMIRRSDRTIIVIVNRSERNGDNPIALEDRIDLIGKAVPESMVFTANNGYLPDIIESLQARRVLSRHDTVRVIAGPDRIESYKRQCVGLPSVSFLTSDRTESATVVRSVIRSGDRKRFNTLVPESIRPAWDMVRRYDADHQ